MPTTIYHGPGILVDSKEHDAHNMGPWGESIQRGTCAAKILGLAAPKRDSLLDTHGVADRPRGIHIWYVNASR